MTGEPRRRPWLFFLLVYLLALPFWALGAATGLEMLPRLPIAALMAVCPVLAAVILTARDEGGAGVAALLRRALDARRLPSALWLAPALLIVPIIRVVEFAVQRLQGVAVPAPQFGLAPLLSLTALFFVGALAEELGWSGYAIEPLQDRWGALAASLLLGVVWAVIHFVPLLQANRSAEWIAWWSLGTVATRVIMVWLFNGAGRSVFAASLYHTTQNVSWQLYPVSGSFEDPMVSGLIMATVALAITLATRGRLAAARPSLTAPVAPG
jgi:hypothetical protein